MAEKRTNGDRQRERQTDTHTHTHTRTQRERTDSESVLCYGSLEVSSTNNNVVGGRKVSERFGVFNLFFSKA